MSYEYVNSTEAYDARKTLALAIAEDLGLQLQPREEPGSYFSLVSRQTPQYGLGLSFSRDTKKGDILHVSGHWPCPTVGSDQSPRTPAQYLRETAPTINVAVNRGPLSVIADIRRRFLTAYDVMFPLLAQRCKEADEYNQDSRDLAAELCLQFKGRMSGGDPTVFYLGDYTHGYQVKCSGRTARIELRDVSAPVAERVLAALIKKAGE